MTRWTRNVCIVYFILGLPGLLFGILAPLMRRFIFEDKSVFKPENREQLIVESCCWMISSTLFGSLIYLLIYCTKP